jgi:predicted ATPase
MTYRFSLLQVRGYRRLRAVELPLEPFNVLIGANGVGKSSILDILDLLASSANGDLENTVSRGGGISSLLTLDGTTDSMDIGISMANERDAPPLQYQVRLSQTGVGFSIAFEELSQHQDRASLQPFKFIDATPSRVRYRVPGEKKFVEPNWDFKYLETALSQVPKMYQQPEMFRRVLADSTEIYHTLDISARAPIRLPQAIQRAETPGPNGEDLVSCLYEMRETDQDRFDSVIDALRAAFPSFERIDFPPVAAGTLTLAWKDRNFTKPVYPHQLSEGTLRFLWLVALLQSQGLPKLTLIDEPEVSLHPEMLRLLAGLMREASTRTQLIVATHSDRFVRFLKPEELLVCDLDGGGGTTVRRASNLDLDAWLADYALDELWSMGRLGGRSVSSQ